MPQALPWARRIDFTTVNGPIPDIPLDAKLLLVCIRGKNAYLLQNRLKSYGYTNTMVLEAGQTLNELQPRCNGKTATTENPTITKD